MFSFEKCCYNTVNVYTQIVFEAVRGNGFSGDIALDDISFTNAQCQSKCFQFQMSGFVII